MKKAIIISCFNWYESRLKYIREYLISRDYNVVILTSDYVHTKKIEVEKRYKECTYIKVPKYKRNISLKRVFSHFYFGKKVKKFINHEKPDVIYTLLPPNNIGKVVSDYKKKNRDVKLIVDIIDLWPESMPVDKFRKLPIIKIWKSWRNEAILAAEHVFTECGLYSKKLSGIINGKKTSILYLCKDQDEKVKQYVYNSLVEKNKDNIVRYAYVGSMNNILDIDGICDVLYKTVKAGYNVELHAIGIGESKELFVQKVKATGCKCVFYGAVFDAMKKAEILCKCDCAFNMMKDTSAVGLTIKSVDYFSMGLPIINNIKGDTWAMVENNHIGLNIADNVFDMEKLEELRSFIVHQKVFDYFNNTFTVEAFKSQVLSGLKCIH